MASASIVIPLHHTKQEAYLHSTHTCGMVVGSTMYTNSILIQVSRPTYSKQQAQLALVHWVVD